MLLLLLLQILGRLCFYLSMNITQCHERIYLAYLPGDVFISGNMQT